MMSECAFEVAMMMVFVKSTVRPMLSVPHLDRDFDYLVSAEQSDDAQPGVRVKVRFHGRLVDAFVLERRSDTDHEGKLGWLDRVVSSERVLTPDVRRLVDAVAARYAGTRPDVLRLAVPPRHATVEKQPPPDVPQVTSTAIDRTAWGDYARGAQFLDALAEGRAARAVWQALPGEQWTDRLAEAAAVVVQSGRSVLAVVPDQSDVDALHAAALIRRLFPQFGDDLRNQFHTGFRAAGAVRLAPHRGDVFAVVRRKRAGHVGVADINANDHVEPFQNVSLRAAVRKRPAFAPRDELLDVPALNRLHAAAFFIIVIVAREFLFCPRVRFLVIAAERHEKINPRTELFHLLARERDAAVAALQHCHQSALRGAGEIRRQHRDDRLRAGPVHQPAFEPPVKSFATAFAFGLFLLPPLLGSRLGQDEVGVAPFAFGGGIENLGAEEAEHFFRIGGRDCSGLFARVGGVKLRGGFAVVVAGDAFAVEDRLNFLRETEASRRTVKRLQRLRAGL